MKFLVVLVFMLPFALKGQTIKSYQQAMEKFKKFYNKGQGDSIKAMLANGRDPVHSNQHLWTNSDMAELLNEYGKLQSFKFIGIDTTDVNKVYVFKTIFSKKGVRATSITLDPNGNIGTFRFVTTSDEIIKLLKSAQNSR